MTERMREARHDVFGMARTIEIRIPGALHRQREDRASGVGITVPDYVLRELERILQHPSVEDVLDRLRARRPPTLTKSAADAIRSDGRLCLRNTP